MKWLYRKLMLLRVVCKVLLRGVESLDCSCHHCLWIDLPVFILQMDRSAGRTARVSNRNLHQVRRSSIVSQFDDVEAADCVKIFAVDVKH